MSAVSDTDDLFGNLPPRYRGRRPRPRPVQKLQEGGVAGADQFGNYQATSFAPANAAAGGVGLGGITSAPGYNPIPAVTVWPSVSTGIYGHVGSTPNYGFMGYGTGPQGFGTPSPAFTPPTYGNVMSNWNGPTGAMDPSITARQTAMGSASPTYGAGDIGVATPTSGENWMQPGVGGQTGAQSFDQYSPLNPGADSGIRGGMGYPAAGLGTTASAFPGDSGVRGGGGNWDPQGTAAYIASGKPLQANSATQALAYNNAARFGNVYANQFPNNPNVGPVAAGTAIAEGGGNPYALNQQGSGAFGLSQWMPGGRLPGAMAAFGSNISPETEALYGVGEIRGGGVPSSVMSTFNNPNATYAQTRDAMIGGFEGLRGNYQMPIDVRNVNQYVNSGRYAQGVAPSSLPGAVGRFAAGGFVAGGGNDPGTGPSEPTQDQSPEFNLKRGLLGRDAGYNPSRGPYIEMPFVPDWRQEQNLHDEGRPGFVRGGGVTRFQTPPANLAGGPYRAPPFQGPPANPFPTAPPLNPATDQLAPSPYQQQPPSQGHWDYGPDPNAYAAAPGTRQLAARGGPVPQHASPSAGRRNDDVPAMLTAGEFVVPRPAAQAIGRPVLQEMVRRAMARANGYG